MSSGSGEEMATDSLERLRRDYAPAFLGYLSQRDERGLRTAYELGRRAMRQELSLLDLAQIHHAHLLQVLKTSRTETELDDVAQAASTFFVEVLATFEMTHRAFTEQRLAGVERQDPAAAERRRPARPPFPRRRPGDG